ncbi:MAG: ATP-binding protein [Candidatus Binatia bacterium]
MTIDFAKTLPRHEPEARGVSEACDPAPPAPSAAPWSGVVDPARQPRTTFRAALRNVIDSGISRDDVRFADASLMRRVRTFNGCALSLILTGPPNIAAYAGAGMHAAALAVLAACLVAVLAMMRLRRNTDLQVPGHMLVANLSALLIYLTLHLGGLFAPGHGWAIVPPLAAGLILGRRGAAFYGVVAIVAEAAYSYLEIHGLTPPTLLPADMRIIFAINAHVTLVIAALALVYTFLAGQEEAEEALTCARDRAEVAARAKSEFLANTSHEIRTPMNVIIGMTEMALDRPLDTETRHYMDRVRAASLGLLTIINDLLDLSKIEAGKMTLEIERFDVRATVDEVAALMGSSAAAKGLTLTRQVDSAVLPLLAGDAARLRQVLLNLIGNGIKFTERGGIDVRVQLLRATAMRMDLQFAVRDTGIGIPSDRQAAVFESFTQADGSTTRKFGGTGLGLTICRDLVRLMGGELQLDSAIGLGSTFSFTLSFERPRDVEAVTSQRSGAR